MKTIEVDNNLHFSICCIEQHTVFKEGLFFNITIRKSVGEKLCFGHFILALMSQRLFNTKWCPCCCFQPIHQSDGSPTAVAVRRSSLWSLWCPEGRPHGETCGWSTLPQWSHGWWRPGELGLSAPAGPSHKRERGCVFSLGHKKCTSKNRLHSLM